MSNKKLELPNQPLLSAKTDKESEWQKQFIKNYWLNLGDTSNLHVDNPFYKRTQFDIENPHAFILDLMRKPEYFGFSVKTLFGKTLAPFQLAILRELWVRPFPMLIGSRGLGKCIKGNSFIVTDSGISRIDALVKNGVLERNYLENVNVLGENGFKKVDYSWNNGLGDIINIRTDMGFELGGTHNHPIRIADEKGIVWKDMSELKVGDKVLIDRNSAWHKNCNDLPEDLSYILGLITGDGGFTKNDEIGFTTADLELAENLNKISLKYWGKDFKKQKAKYQYLLCSLSIRDKLFSEYGFPSSVCEHKSFPSSVLSSSKKSCAAFIRGLFDTDGCVEKSQVSFSAKSSEMIRTLQFVLTRFGIISKRFSRLNKRYNRYYHYLQISGYNAKIFAKEIGFGLTRKMEKLNKLINVKTNPNKDFIPNSLILKDLLYLSTNSVRKKGYGRRKNVFSAYKIKNYQNSYDKCKKILLSSEELKNTNEHIRISDFIEKNYYYDAITDISYSEDYSYDVHIPEDHSFISNGFISHNSWLLALYAMLRGLFNQGTKIVIVGAAFRQSKVVFDYCQDLWENGPVFRDIVGLDRRNGPKRDVDRCTLRIGDSLIVALPIGDGSKIRGQRANIIISEEFASLSKDIFETVVRGFAAVSQDPIEKFQKEAKKHAIKKLGLWTKAHELLEESTLLSNQTIVCGTAYYSFNHFFEYWKRYKSIVNSRGNVKKLEEIFSGKIPKDFNWKDYSVIRIPVDRMPEGFMDQKQVAQAKATVHSGTYNMEYGACFQTDSNGFFKRSLIESCVVGKKETPITHPSSGEIRFSAALRGHPGRKYVMAVDPASEADNFSVSVLECWDDHRRIVYAWTTTRSRHKEKVKKGIVKEQDYYGYAARKIRDLCRDFPCERIAIDSQGGGIAVIEALQDESKLLPGEKRFLPVMEEGKPKDTDGMIGEHIIEAIEFARADWVRDANHGMRKDFEDKSLLFPEFDPAILALSFLEDKATGRVKVDSDDATVEKLYDTLEDCVLEIEELKDELASIVHTQTGTSGRDHWDVPEVKQAGGKKGRLRKDRYSSLLMANMIGRTMQRAAPEREYEPSGGFAHDIGNQKFDKNHNAMWITKGGEGAWWAEKSRQNFQDGSGYGAVVKRTGR